MLIVAFFQQTAFMNEHGHRAWPPHFFEASLLILLLYYAVLGWKRPGSWPKTFLFFFVCAAGIWAAERFGILVPRKDFLGLLIAVLGVHKALFSHADRRKTQWMRVIAFVGFSFAIMEAREAAFDWQLAEYGAEGAGQIVRTYETSLGWIGRGPTADSLHAVVEFKDQNGIFRSCKKDLSHEEMRRRDGDLFVPLIYSRKDPYTVSFEQKKLEIFDRGSVFPFSAGCLVMAGFLMAEYLVRRRERGRVVLPPSTEPVHDTKASYKITVRRMTDEERAEIEKRTRHIRLRNILQHDRFWMSRAEVEKVRLSFEKDLEDGHVQVLRLITEKAVEFSWGSDNMFFCEAGPLALFHMNFRDWPIASRRSSADFPNTEIELVRARQSGFIFALRCLGKKIDAEPAKFEDDDALDFDTLLLRGGDIVEGTLGGLRLLSSKCRVLA